MNRRDFFLSLAVVPGILSEAALRATTSAPSLFRPLTLLGTEPVRFVLRDMLEHPFYWWPRTLLSYPVELGAAADPTKLALVRVDTRKDAIVATGSRGRDASAASRAPCP